MIKEKRICGCCTEWRLCSGTDRYGYCRVHDMAKEYSDTCGRFNLSEWFVDNDAHVNAYVTGYTDALSDAMRASVEGIQALRKKNT